MKHNHFKKIKWERKAFFWINHIGQISTFYIQSVLKVFAKILILNIKSFLLNSLAKYYYQIQILDFNQNVIILEKEVLTL